MLQNDDEWIPPIRLRSGQALALAMTASQSSRSNWVALADPWHISRFHPQYKYLDSIPTPIRTLERACDIGKAAGLHYVYLGNVPGAKSESTFCYNCGRMLIERIGYHIATNHIRDSRCPDRASIAGYEISA